MRRALLSLVVILWASSGAAQAVSPSGFVDGSVFGFPQTVPNDATRIVGDALFRNEIVLRPADWFQLAAGLDLRVNSHDQVEDRWRLDVEDRGVLRPRAAVRRLAATVAARGFTLDVGKQFIRWGRADIIYPTDRFAPRDFLNVIDSELLPVIGARGSIQIASETLEAVWVPRLTPSRLPLLDQRWAAVPPEAAVFSVADGGSVIPRGSQYGARWRHTSSRVETALSFFDGFNHLPDIDVRPRSDPAAIDIVRVYPAIRMYGGDIALPTDRLTLKAEAAYVTSPPSTSDEYLLYVIEAERQTGEWLLDVGYAGEMVRQSRVPVVFSPDRNMARSIIGRASYTVDPRRTVIIEGAARQSGDGFYAKLQYSQAMTQHWHLTLTGVGLAGEPGNFLGRYRRNSHGSVALRFSY
ncbi:MAG TPA: hypothetical protein VEL79_19745 [Vicinamibacterales bacterium]|nr:hypothetical protein [Vicinamibacterales bacterium]